MLFRSGLAGVALLLVIPLAFLPWARIQAGRDGTGPGPAATNWSIRRAITEPVIWAMFAVYFLTSTAISVIQPQMVAYLVEVGFAPLTSATAVGFAPR